jgi:hypothetical protein
VNQGGEPGHDDYGLPRVDIEVPDDARELYRDVQAYYRELRALRRHQRSRRLRAPFQQPGMTLPLIAGCLVLAMIAGMVVTMFSANLSGISGRGSSSSAQAHRSSRTAKSSSSQSGSGAAAAAPSGLAAPAQASSGPLPSKTIRVAGKPVALRPLRSTALAIIPVKCDCVLAVRQLLSQARTAGIAVYLVGTQGSSVAELTRLAAVPGQGARPAVVATDFGDALGSVYRRNGLTVLLVDSRGFVKEDLELPPAQQLERQLQLLKTAR